MILNEMAISRQQALSVVDSYVVEYSNHLLKCIIFKNTTNTLNHWISEISNYFNEINNIKIKPDNKKMREDYLYDYFFLASGVIFKNSSNKINEITKTNNTKANYDDVWNKTKASHYFTSFSSNFLISFHEASLV